MDKKQPLEVIPSKEEKTLISWTTFSRPFQKKDREFWSTVLATLALISLILFFVQEWFLIATFLSLAFLYYVLTTIEPEKITYRITNKGVYLPGTQQRIDWDWLESFWLSDKWGWKILNIRTRMLESPRLVHLVINKDKEKQLKRVLFRYLPEEPEKPTFIDKLSAWLYRQLPIESKTKNQSNRSNHPN
jgi:hypothetical protein